MFTATPCGKYSSNVEELYVALFAIFEVEPDEVYLAAESVMRHRSQLINAMEHDAEDTSACISALIQHHKSIDIIQLFRERTARQRRNIKNVMRELELTEKAIRRLAFDKRKIPGSCNCMLRKETQTDFSPEEQMLLRETGNVYIILAYKVYSCVSCDTHWVYVSDPGADYLPRWLPWNPEDYPLV